MENNALSKEKRTNIFDFEVTQYTQIKPEEPTLYIGGSLFGAKSQLSFISGKPKAGKTSVASIIIASCLVENPTFDTLGIQGIFCQNQPIFYIDTEQSKGSSKKIIERVCKLTNLPEQPTNLKVFNLRLESVDERKRCIKELFELFEGSNKGDVPYMVFIDGIGDLVKSTNDEAAAVELLQTLAYYAEKHNTSLVLFLHETATSEKMRGHLGSEAERKCFASISISKNRETQTHSIKAKQFRDSKDFEEILFRYDDQTNTMVTISGKNREIVKQQREVEIENLGNLIKEGEEVSSTELTNRVMEFKKCSKSTALQKIKNLVDRKILAKEEKSTNRFLFTLFKNTTTTQHPFDGLV